MQLPKEYFSEAWLTGKWKLRLFLYTTVFDAKKAEFSLFSQSLFGKRIFAVILDKKNPAFKVEMEHHYATIDNRRLSPTLR